MVLGEPAFPPWSRREAEQYWDRSGRAAAGGAGAFLDFEYNFPPPSESVAFAWHAVGAAQICSALVAMRAVMAEAKVNKWCWFGLNAGSCEKERLSKQYTARRTFSMTDSLTVQARLDSSWRL